MAEFDKIADTYDLMINWSSRLTREMPFFEKIIKSRSVSDILDIGCATGNHARAFAQLATTVTAIDPSEEMLKIATRLTTGDNPRYITGGLGMSLPDKTYDMITILGNTITLTSTLEKLEESISDLHEKLNDNGILIIQMVNYDKIIKNENLIFPAIKKKREDTEYIFLREYRLVDNCPELTVITIELKGEEVQSKIEHTKHLPLTSDKFINILQNTGYHNIKFLADYNYTPFNPNDSASLIVLAEK